MIVSFIPTNQPLDLSARRRAEVSLVKALPSPGADTDTDIRIGQTIAAWQCGANRGMTLMIRVSGPDPTDMLKQGWGFAPVPSMGTEAKFSPGGEDRLANHEGIETGRAVVTAVEVSRFDCAAMCAELTRFVTHPNAPADKPSLMRSPGRFEGAGCIGFGFDLATWRA